MIDVETIFDSDREEYEFMQERKEQPMKEQIKELTNELIFTKNYGRLDAVAKHLYEKGYRKQKENVIELPCKIGDTVYIIDDSEDEYGESYVLGVEVLQFFINKNGIALDLKMPLGLRINTWAVVGKNVFLTEAEAEKALAKMKGGE